MKNESDVNKKHKIRYQESVTMLNVKWLNLLIKEKDSIPIWMAIIKKNWKKQSIDKSVLNLIQC